MIVCISSQDLFCNAYINFFYILHLGYVEGEKPLRFHQNILICVSKIFKDKFLSYVEMPPDYQTS